MKTSDYWQQRFEQLSESLLTTGERYYYEEVEKQFRLAARELEKEISMWYKRLALNNDISMVEAKKLLTSNELQEFRWSVEEYIKRGKENGITGRWEKELENASARAHISRLDAMKLQMQQQMEVLYGNQLDSLDKHLSDVYSQGFYRSAYEIDKGIGVGTQLSQLDPDRIRDVLSKPWVSDGRNFSDRLWRDKDLLLNTLQTELTQATIRGEPLNKVVDLMAEKLNVAKSALSNLVMTETAFFASKGQHDCFECLGVKKYEFLATLDRRTSRTCQHMDKKTFLLKEYKTGTNAPPMHCRCRSCIVPYFGDEEEHADMRAARDENGKTKMISAKLSYPEWKKNFVKPEPQEISKKTIAESKEEKYNKGIEETYKKALAFGKRTGNEGLYWLDEKGASAYPDLTGDSNSVQLTQDLVDFISKAPHGSLTSIHNHPGSSAFSDADLSIMCQYPSIDCLRVIGHDGTEYYASVGDGERPDYRILKATYEKAIQDLMKVFKPKVQSGELDKKSAWKEHTHQAIAKVAEKFKWKYERTLPDEK